MQINQHMSCQDQCGTNTVHNSGDNTKNKSQPCDIEEIVTWQITGMAKMNALKEIRDRNTPKKVNNKFKHMQISIATKEKP